MNMRGLRSSREGDAGSGGLGLQLLSVGYRDAVSDAGAVAAQNE